MVITEEAIALAESKGACQSGLEQARKYIGQDVSCLDPEYVLWSAQYFAEIEPDTLRMCAEKAPDTALRYAARRLDPDTLRMCAEKAPDTALRYAARRLDPDTLRTCAEKAPWAALEYAVQYLDKATLRMCAEKTTGVTC